jgi:molybdate transport system substrate-binding protein
MRLAGVVVAAALVLAGCAGPSASGDGTGSDPGSGAPAGVPEGVQQVRVLADESLRPAFDQIEVLFEQQNPSVDVVLAYGEGIDLARQIAGGEPAHVFASDDPSALATVGAAEVFAGGRLGVAALDPAGAPFVTFVKEGDAQRVLTDTGILRP